MKKEIFINATTGETRVAFLEDGQLVELYLERPENERMVGDIYKGKVENVLPGMMAAFVNIGLDQNAFLHFSDVGESADRDLYDDTDDAEGENGSSSPHTRKNPYNNLKPGQDIVVQVTKEPISTKGARVTTEVAIPGRFLVLVPNNSRIGVSRKIDDVREKRRLKKIAREIRQDNHGMIIRTVASGKDDATLKRDLGTLMTIWNKIKRGVAKQKAPCLLYKDLSMASSIIRDLFTNDVDQVVVDSKKLFKRISGYLKEASPQLVPRVMFYNQKEPIFDYYGIEPDIEKSFHRKVWLKGGGYIVIDHTEALVSIDVNSGKYIGKHDHEKNSLRVNVEAAREIARQLRLRDIGGLIMIDFIDMEQESNRKRIYDELRKELKRDRAKSVVQEISAFGIIEMTRQRVRPSLLFTMSETCPYCEGTGRIASKDTVVSRIERWMKRYKMKSRERRLVLKVHPEVASFLSNGMGKKLFWMMMKYWIKIDVQSDLGYRRDEFHVFSKKTNEDLTNKFIN